MKNFLTFILKTIVGTLVAMFTILAFTIGVAAWAEHQQPEECAWDDVECILTQDL